VAVVNALQLEVTLLHAKNVMRCGKWCKIRCHLVLFTNKKSHTIFQLVSKSVTLNDLEQHNDHWCTLSGAELLVENN